MRLVQKLVAIIWVVTDATELKMSEGKSAKEKQNVTLVHLPNEAGVLISTGKLDGRTHPSFHSIRSLPKSNSGMRNSKARPLKGDYALQGRFTKIFFRVILMWKQGRLGTWVRSITWKSLYYVPYFCCNASKVIFFFFNWIGYFSHQLWQHSILAFVYCMTCVSCPELHWWCCSDLEHCNVRSSCQK